MTVSFPAIKATGHEFGEPSWPVTERRAQSGVRSVRQWGSLAGDAPMTLEFSNITQAAYAQIRAAHTAALGPMDDVAFPAIVGQNLSEVDLFNPGPGLKWFFASPPECSRVPGGRRISCLCVFRAELRL